MTKIKVSPLASKKATTKKALAKAAVAAQAAAKSSKSALPAKRVSPKVSPKKKAVPPKTLEPKKVGVLKAKLGRPVKLWPVAECSCDPVVAAQDMASPKMEKLAYGFSLVDGVDLEGTEFPSAESQRSSPHTVELPRRKRSSAQRDGRKGWTALSAADNIEDQLASDAGAPKQRMAKAGPAKRPITPLGSVSSDSSSDFMSSPTDWYGCASSDDPSMDSIFGIKSGTYTSIVVAKAKALLDVADLSGVGAALDSMIDDIDSETHIPPCDHLLVRDQVLLLALTTAKERIPAAKIVENTNRRIRLTKIYEELRSKISDPKTEDLDECQSKEDDFVPTTADAAARSKAEADRIAKDLAALVEAAKAKIQSNVGAGGCPGGCPGGADGAAGEQGWNKTSPNGKSLRYSYYKSLMGLDSQEFLSLSDDYHDPIVKVFTLRGCALVSMDPRYDIDVRDAGDGSAVVELRAKVRDTADGSDTQLGILFLGAKRGFAGVEAATSGWSDAESMEINSYCESSKVFLLRD